MPRFVLLMALICCGLQLSATDPSELRQRVLDAVTYPTHLESYNEVEIVLVEYTILTDGTLRIHSTNASDERFRRYVEDSLKKLTLLGVDEPVTQSVKFSFVRR